MSQTREDRADALLNEIRQSSRGTLTVFLGAAPGVGKTYAMLAAAAEKRRSGIDTLVGLVETHGRKDTDEMVDGFDVLPRKTSDYQGTTLTEFDVDAAMARHPALILVDELAHTNIPGSRNKRRFQDVEELLNAGIDVYTTVNIQHLVGLNDKVKQITGVRVSETLPDHVLDKADIIRFIDLPPRSLIERLKEGKVYLPDFAEKALEGFFSEQNLSALRELAMKKSLERVDAGLLEQRDFDHNKNRVVLNDQLLVLISANSDQHHLIRIGRQMAERRQIAMHVVWVDTGRVRSLTDRNRIDSALTLARELGAQTDILRGSSAFAAAMDYIQDHPIGTVLVGAGTRRRWRWWHPRLYRRLIESGLALEVSVYRQPNEQKRRLSFIRPSENTATMQSYLWSMATALLVTALCIPLELFLNTGNLALIYVLSVVTIGLRFGNQPALLSAFLSFILFNFFLTEPKYTFIVDEKDDIATLFFMTLTALLSGPVASRIRRQFILLRESNRVAEILRQMAEKLSTATTEANVWEQLHQLIEKATGNNAIVATHDGQKRLFISTYQGVDKTNDALIRWCEKNKARAGRGTDTLSAAKMTAQPIVADNSVIAVVLYQCSEVENSDATTTGLITAMSQQASNAWRRVAFSRRLESERIKVEMEQLRSALLSSVSHDLKSPLSAMMGAAESLKLLKNQLSREDQDELTDMIMSESRRLDNYIQNLLDMTRLGHGELKIERDWISIDDICRSAAQRLNRYMPDVQVKFVLLTQPPLLFVHAALVEQGIFNILENAAKYTPDDNPVIVELSHTDNDCIIAIEDKGPGIPEAQREQIFDMFYVVADGDRKKQNTGMGLAICKGMIGAHGGSVKAMSGNSGKGTRFEIRLPLSVNTIEQETNQ